MCWSIILGIAGIIFEFFSVLVIVYELFFPRDYKKWKYKHYEHTGATDREKYERAKKKGVNIYNSSHNWINITNNWFTN